MTDLRFTDRPQLRRPLLIAGFAGWNDAGESATGAVRFMQRRWRAAQFADIDPESFYDFTQIRPKVRLRDQQRVIEWPENNISGRQLEDSDRDIILLSGIEPHLGWRTYCEAILRLCSEYEVSGVIILGALLSETSHKQPVRVSGSSANDELAQLLDLAPSTTSTYEGPTGIVGTLTQALRDEGYPTASLWANVPFYVQRSPNPKGALALLQRLNDSLKLDLTLHDLEVFSARFDAQVSSDIEDNPEIAEFAERMETESDEFNGDPFEDDELPDAESMVNELEQFLRRNREDTDDEGDS